jgi:hypothetical protein
MVRDLHRTPLGPVVQAASLLAEHCADIDGRTADLPGSLTIVKTSRARTRRSAATSARAGRDSIVRPA